jgi:galactose-1-phosphate uridylyltransferase
MAKIAFQREMSTAMIRNPHKGFAEEQHHIEVRRDPLLGHRSVYNAGLREKVKFFFGDCDAKLLEEMVATTSLTCPFCPDRLDKSTPAFRADVIPEGRMRLHEAVLFPNLYPVGKWHAVVTLTHAHFLALSRFVPSLIANGFRLAQRFIKTVYERDRDARYATVNANYLFPAGATLVHPHLQLLVTPEPFTHHERLIHAAEEYYGKHGSCYFLDLAAEEKGLTLRYVTQRGKWHWITAFSPMGMNEVTAVHQGSADFGVLADADLDDLSYGISKVLHLYETLGYLSFNYSLMSVRAPRYGESCRCIVRIVNRQNLYLNYRNDDYFLQKLLQSDFIITPPEDLASQLRPLFSGS